MRLIETVVATNNDISTAQKIVRMLDKNEIIGATLLLNELAESIEFPKYWIQSTLHALKTGDWAKLSKGFINREFIGSNGYFLIIAPYKLSRKNGETIKLCALLGKVIFVDIIPVRELEEHVLNIFGRLIQPISELIPFICIGCCDRFNHSDSEAFIVPESWMIPGSVEGPTLNNMTQHRRRFNEIVRKNIPCIFEPDTSNLLLSSLDNELDGLHRQHVEYQYHDAGHATGLGIKHKVKDNLCPSYWYAGIEEWRSDSVEFDLAYRTLSTLDAGRLVAANFCLRFGIDAQRYGGIDFDAHATSCLITLEYLFRSAAIFIKEGKLALRSPTFNGLINCIKLQSAEAIALTQKEMAVENVTGIFGCYQSISVHQSTKEIFQEYVFIPQ
jgi:Family of unknown function (DUF6014)